jgi:hypothetical protein
MRTIFPGALIGLFVASVALRWRVVAFFGAAVLAHLPFVASVYWAVFRWNGLCRPILLGWTTFLLSAVLWEVAYALLYQRLGLPSPDLPGEVLFGIPFGWAPAAGMTCIAEITKNTLKHWFLGRDG